MSAPETQARDEGTSAGSPDAHSRSRAAYVDAHRRRVLEERAASGESDASDTLRLDLADARRELAVANRIVSLASALVSHGDAAGFDASVFEDCSPGFQADFHALRQALSGVARCPLSELLGSLRIVPSALGNRELSGICRDLASDVAIDEALVGKVWRAAVTHASGACPDYEALKILQRMDEREAKRFAKKAERTIGQLEASLEGAERKLEAVDDYVSHHGDWKRACEIARDAAGPSGPDHDDRGYWQHQVDTLDRIEAAFRRDRTALPERASGAGAA